MSSFIVLNFVVFKVQYNSSSMNLVGCWDIIQIYFFKKPTLFWNIFRDLKYKSKKIFEEQIGWRNLKIYWYSQKLWHVLLHLQLQFNKTWSYYLKIMFILRYVCLPRFGWTTSMICRYAWERCSWNLAHLHQFDKLHSVSLKNKICQF